jgi:hypothetical protein
MGKEGRGAGIENSAGIGAVDEEAGIGEREPMFTPISRPAGRTEQFKTRQSCWVALNPTILMVKRKNDAA